MGLPAASQERLSGFSVFPIFRFSKESLQALGEWQLEGSRHPRLPLAPQELAREPALKTDLAPVALTGAGPILALDMGKYKSVACVYRWAAELHFHSLVTGRAELARLRERRRPAVVLPGFGSWHPPAPTAGKPRCQERLRGRESNRLERIGVCVTLKSPRIILAFREGIWLYSLLENGRRMTR